MPIKLKMPKKGRPKGAKDKKQRPRHIPNEHVKKVEKANPEKTQEVIDELDVKINTWSKRRGAPTLYREEYCKQLMLHMGRGYSFQTFGAKIMVTIGTLYDWSKSHPEFADAKQIGEQLSHYWWENQGKQGLNTGPASFHGQVWSITMKNRFGYRDKQEVTHFGADGGPVEIVKRIVWDDKAEERLRELDAKAERMADMMERKSL